MPDQPAPETVEAPAEEEIEGAPAAEAEAAAPVVRRKPDRTPLSQRDPVSLANHFAASGYFSDAREMSQAVVKMVAGESLGLPPTVAMQEIHFIDGKLSPSANLMRTLVRRHDAYDYSIVEVTDEKAEILWTQNGEEIGRSTFTIEEARRAGLVKSGSGWEKYPSDMLFARATSRGLRRFCPDTLVGHTPYVPEELGANVNEYGEPVGAAPVRDGLPSGEAHDEAPSERDLIAALGLPEDLKASLISSVERANELAPHSWGVAKLAMRLQNRTEADARQVLDEIEGEIAKAEARIADAAAEPGEPVDAEVVEDAVVDAEEDAIEEAQRPPEGEVPVEPEDEEPSGKKELPTAPEANYEKLPAAGLDLHDVIYYDGKNREVEGMTKGDKVVRVRLTGISKTVNLGVDERVGRVVSGS